MPTAATLPSVATPPAAASLGTGEVLGSADSVAGPLESSGCVLIAFFLSRATPACDPVSSAREPPGRPGAGPAHPRRPSAQGMFMKLRGSALPFSGMASVGWVPCLNHIRSEFGSLEGAIFPVLRSMLYCTIRRDAGG